MPRIEKYRAKDGQWCIVTVPDDWDSSKLQYTDLLPPASTADSYFNTEAEADAEILRRLRAKDD